MEQPERNPGSPHDLVRLGITLAAICIALASLRPESPAVVFFLVTGLLATTGTGYALAALWEAAGLSARDLVARGSGEEWWENRHTALLVLTWAMVGLVITYATLLYFDYY